MDYKYVQIAEMLRNRIKNGDYAFSSFPGAKKVAAEIDCSYLTARQAVQLLRSEGVLRKISNGRRFEIKKKNTRSLKVAIIHHSSEFTKWGNVIYSMALEYGCKVQTVLYNHINDPIIFEALNGDFDLIFSFCMRNDRLYIDKLRKRRDRVVTLFEDLTEYGIRCLDGLQLTKVHELMSHLHRLGHTRIACLETSQSSDIVIRKKVELWRESLKKLGITGAYHQKSCDHFTLSYINAYNFTREILANGGFTDTAIFCPISGNAIGVLRALHESGIKVPDDISLCGFGDLELASMTIPAITVINDSDISSPIRAILELFCNGAGDKRRLLYTYEGETPICGQTIGLPKLAAPPRKNKPAICPKT